MVCGLPGTGKTTVAKELESITGGIVIRTDEIRKQIFSDPQYTEKEKQKVYDAFFRTAESLLRTGRNVILDATFYKKEQRKAAVDMARKAGSGALVIEVRCDERTVEKRLRKRKGGLSDADYGVYRKIKSLWEPVEEKHEVVDGGGRGWRRDLKEIVERE